MKAQPSSPRTIVGKAVRFPVVGLLSSAVYALVASLLIARFQVGSQVAALLAYLTALPISFFGHRNFTFASTGSVVGQAPRFVLVHGIGMLISSGAMWLTDSFAIHYVFGIASAIVLVPLITFFVIDRWVFR